MASWTYNMFSSRPLISLNIEAETNLFSAAAELGLGRLMTSGQLFSLPGSTFFASSNRQSSLKNGQNSWLNEYNYV